MASRKPSASIARRVAVGAGVSAGMGALVAALVTIVVVDGLISERADQRLRAATVTLAGELDEEVDEADGSFAEVLDDENEEIVTSGIRLALYDEKTLLAGDPWVPRVGGNECVSRGELGKRLRACGRSYGSFRVVAAQRKDSDSLRIAYVVAGSSAFGVAFALSLLVSGLLTRWATRPLTSLFERVRALPPDDPDPSHLGPASNVEEVDGLRSALSDLLLRSAEHLAHVERFAADAAHELSTPLTVLRGELELLAEDSNDAMRERVVQLAERTQALTELVERLLLLASPRTQTGTELPPVSMHDIIDEVVATLPKQTRSRVQSNLSGEALVRGDAPLLRTLVVNLLENALKFSESDVTLTLLDDSDSDHAAASDAGPRLVTLEVRDRGAGIPAALRERVFQPFFRVRASSARGTGLGLALVRQIVDAHAGEVELRDGHPGTTFVVRLPPWKE